MKDIKFNTLMKKADEGTIEIDMWQVVRENNGVVQIITSKGERKMVTVNDLPQSFVAQYNA